MTGPPASSLIEGLRTFLYVPGDRPERFETALASGAGAVIVDLEDAVAPAAKDSARRHATAFLGAVERSGPQIWIRVNSDEEAKHDVRMAAEASPDGLVVAKASAESLAWIAAQVPRLPLIALVESASALVEVHLLAEASNVIALALGEVDLSADIGLDPNLDERLLAPIRLQLVIASTAHGLAPPIGAVFTRIGDDEGLDASTFALRQLGFRCRQAIHPAQIATIDRQFTPTPDDVANATRVVALAKASSFGAAIDEGGRLIDEAVVRAARQCLLRAGVTIEEVGRPDERTT